MNTLHKWNRYNGNVYQFYSTNSYKPSCASNTIDALGTVVQNGDYKFDAKDNLED